MISSDAADTPSSICSRRFCASARYFSGMSVVKNFRCVLSVMSRVTSCIRIRSMIPSRASS